MKTKIINLPYRINIANNFWTRFKGLQFQKKPLVEEGLLITPCNSIHMFFMRFPIDVVFLYQSNNVVKIVSNINPWRIVPPVKDAHSALELPSGTIIEKNICVDDKITFIQKFNKLIA
nr:DUF192 domain-containing protein [Paenisporosarcina sp. TG20]